MFLQKFSWNNKLRSSREKNSVLSQTHPGPGLVQSGCFERHPFLLLCAAIEEDPEGAAEGG